MKEYFDTKEQAESYKQKHELTSRTAEYIPCHDKWALVFQVKTTKKED